MKNAIKCIIIAVGLFSFATMVLANSGPVFWQGYPSSEIMLIEDNCPIEIKNENLVFDFSSFKGSDYTISSKVTAAYRMFNPTNEPQSVQMAFPFVGSLDSLVPEDIHITADDSVLPYDVYVGDVVDSYGDPLQDDKKVSFDFAGIVSTITDELYQGKNFPEDEKGKLYTVNVKPTTDQRINFAVDFNFDDKKTKVLTKGFNRYERNDAKTKIAAWCYEPETVEIFVLGEDVELTINAYSDGELREKTDLLTYQISTQEIEIKPYLMKYIKNHTKVKNEGVISDTQLYNLYAKALDKSFSYNMGYSSMDDLTAEEHYQRILTIVYSVEFPEISEKKVSVSYITSGTMDKTETAKPQYTFDYILNPAEHWGDFKNLNVKIITPQKAPYIIKSSIKLAKGENNTYTATLNDLPEDDLSFTLYEDEKISPVDQALGKLQRSFGYFTLVMISAIAVIFVGVIALRRLCRR
ncbi:MAG: hypothetical protein AAGU27_04205 [Dehalobacterium sp.]